MSIQEKLFPWAVVAILILSGLLFWMWYENGRNQTSAALDRDRLLAGNAHLKSELAMRDSLISKERENRAAVESEFVKEQTKAKSEIERLKRKERGLRSNPEVITLTDTIFAEYDTALIRAEQQADADSLSFEREIEILQQSKLSLKTAYDSTFQQLLTLNDALITTEKKLTRMEKLARFFGISSATLAVVVAVLAIAL